MGERRRGFRWNPNGLISGSNVTGVLELWAQDNDPSTGPSTDSHLIFDQNGRIATRSHSGAAITVPDAYPAGEMIELRYTFAESGNSQRQGIFMDVRTNVANSSTIRGVEISAQQEGAVAVGTLSGGTFKAITRSSSTGNITNMYGLEAETTHNDSGYTGTVADLAGVRVKVSLEDGATYTKSTGILVQVEPITGAKAIGSIMRAEATAGGATASLALDTSAINLTVSDTDKVTLWKFARGDGTAVFMRYDTSDNALVFATS